MAARLYANRWLICGAGPCTQPTRLSLAHIAAQLREHHEFSFKTWLHQLRERKSLMMMMITITVLTLRAWAAHQWQDNNNQMAVIFLLTLPGELIISKVIATNHAFELVFCSCLFLFGCTFIQFSIHRPSRKIPRGPHYKYKKISL